MSKSISIFATAVALTAATGLPVPALAQQDDGEKQFGIVHFETSCNETAQRRFDRAMRYQHSFWYQSSKEIFEETLKADPECGIAYWGIALSLLLNPHVPPPAKNLAEGAAAIAKAKSVGAKSQRERDFIDALAGGRNRPNLVQSVEALIGNDGPGGSRRDVRGAGLVAPLHTRF